MPEIILIHDPHPDPQCQHAHRVAILAAVLAYAPPSQLCLLPTHEEKPDGHHLCVS